jgi:Na+-translocating ferredoxin:NAD+ oxidoreductase subunit C
MFKGGVKLIDFKAFSKGEKIENFPAPETAVIPLSQHAGLPAKPTVKKGDEVTERQVIGEASGFISGFVHSSISGKVVKIEPRTIPTGKSSLCVVIKNSDSITTPQPVKRDWHTLNSDEIIKIVRESGIVGLGGANFPSDVKMNLPAGRKAENVILNACECEPFLTADYRVLMEHTTEVLEGLRIICKTVGVKKAYIGIEANKLDAAGIIADKLKNTASSPDIEIKILEEKYPQGSEKHLIKAITGREIPSGKLPLDVGSVVFNVQTTLAVKKAVTDGYPLTERVLTVSGLVEKTGNFRVKIGTSVADILNHCGGKITEDKKLIIGGPMMGINIPSAEVPVTKGTTGILLLPREETGRDIQPCIRCGKCIENCPMRLLPAEIGRYAENSKWDECEKLGVADCIECGCCSYICPAKRPLVEFFKLAKAKLRERK